MSGETEGTGIVDTLGADGPGVGDVGFEGDETTASEQISCEEFPEDSEHCLPLSGNALGNNTGEEGGDSVTHIGCSVVPVHCALEKYVTIKTQLFLHLHICFLSFLWALL